MYEFMTKRLFHNRSADGVRGSCSRHRATVRRMVCEFEREKSPVLSKDLGKRRTKTSKMRTCVRTRDASPDVLRVNPPAIFSRRKSQRDARWWNRRYHKGRRQNVRNDE